MTISYYRAISLFGLMLCLSYFTSTIYATTVIPDSTFDRTIVKSRLENLDFFVRTRPNADTERHIHGFVVLARRTAERVLGESTIYFPIIEKKIAELGLPDDLKYLTVVESMLNPKAESYAGAKGMWQLMPFIAEDYGIQMDDFTDERFHIAKSAEAGLSYLKELYDRFENWELALAAYNCGASRVNRVLKQTGKKSYWGIRHLLPRQTREFVPKLVAVKYLFDHYQNHGIQPQFPSVDLQLTESIEIAAGKSYQDIGQLTQLSGGLISFLNPSYIYEPTFSDLGKIEMVLPSRVANAVVRHLDVERKYQDLTYRTDSSTTVNPYYKIIYEVPDSMSLNAFCQLHDLSPSQIWLWNKLISADLLPGQEVFRYAYKDLKLEYKLSSKDLIDIKVSRIEYPMISLLDTIQNDQIKNQSAQLIKGENTDIALLR